MKHVVALAFLAAAACGGKPAPTVGNAGGGGATTPAIEAGTHGCHFVVGQDVFPVHRCDVAAGGLEKVSGMETFLGTLAPMGSGVHLKAQMGCGPMIAQCDQRFEVHLERIGDAWQGTVVAPSNGQAEGEWWLSGATFVLDASTEYGGLHYGGE